MEGYKLSLKNLEEQLSMLGYIKEEPIEKNSLSVSLINEYEDKVEVEFDEDPRTFTITKPALDVLMSEHWRPIGFDKQDRIMMQSEHDNSYVLYLITEVDDYDS